MLGQNSQSLKIKSEWDKPKGLAIVYPEKLPKNPKEIKKEELINFYDAFIKSIIENAEIKELTIINRPGLKEKLSKKFPYSNIKYIELNYVQDIWIRDWAPIASTEDRVIKSYYLPQYFTKKEKQYADLDDKAGTEISKDHLKFEIIHLTYRKQRLILEGGNFIHNGNGIGIVTNRIIADNESFLIAEIREIFKEQLGISKLIIVPVEPGDESGHVDGMIRFIDKKTVVVATYPKEYKKQLNNITEEELKQGKEFLDSLAFTLENHFKVIRIINAIPKDYKDKSKDFPSAFGNYINFLRIRNKIFLPQYGIDEDKAARQKYEEYFEVIPVETDIKKLADLGGVLNCITWVYY